MKRWVMALVLASVPASAQAMTVAEFLAKANALKAKGVLAMMSPDLGLLTEEVKSAGAAYRRGLAAEAAAGRKPSSCPPPIGKTGVGSNEIMAHFSSIPAARRNVSVEKAFIAMMRQRFPCKG